MSRFPCAGHSAALFAAELEMIYFLSPPSSSLPHRSSLCLTFAIIVSPYSHHLTHDAASSLPCLYLPYCTLLNLFLHYFRLRVLFRALFFPSVHSNIPSYNRLPPIIRHFRPLLRPVRPRPPPFFLLMLILLRSVLEILYLYLPPPYHRHRHCD